VAILGAGLIDSRRFRALTRRGPDYAVDPIRYRREAALALGATVALDPNVEGRNLVRRIQDLCRGKTTRELAGGGNVGPDFVLEAVGGDLFPPKAEVGPDPTGILSLQQAWELCSPVGHLVTVSGLSARQCRRFRPPSGRVVKISRGTWPA
jgi:threonine dehydrogenase-like Zn-dependent dehydrogenase